MQARNALQCHKKDQTSEQCELRVQLDVINARLTKLMGERAELQEYTKLNAERRCLEFLILTGDNTGAAKELAEVRVALGCG